MDKFSASLLGLIEQHAPAGSEVSTISNAKPYWVERVTPEGVYVKTEKSRALGTGPQLIPAWMFEAAWRALSERRELTNKHLLSEAGLNVKRSSAVCAILARLPGVEVASRRPVVLRLKDP